MKLHKKPFILALAVATGIAAIATTQVRASADSQLLALMPPDSKVLIGARVDQAVASPAGQMFAARMPLDHLKDIAGFDIRTDLLEVMVSPSEKFGAARGTFPVSRLEQFLQEEGKPVETYRGIRLVGHTQEKAAFLDGSTVVIGPADTVRQAIDRWIAHAQAPANELTAKVAEVSATSHAWLAATNVSSLQSMIGPSQDQQANIVRNVLNKVVTVSGNLTLPQTGGVSIEGQLLATSPDDAQALMDAYQALRLLAPADAANHPLFHRPQLNLSGSTIHLGLVVTQQEVEALQH